MSSFSSPNPSESSAIPIIALTSKTKIPINSLYNELRIEIFKYINTPISLLLTDRKWLAISKGPHARAEWLIYKYGKAHALFHAIRLYTENFVTLDVVNSLIAKNAIVSRYFIQRLMMNFGLPDQKLINFKLDHLNQSSVDRIDRIRENQNRAGTTWASKLPISIFNHLLSESYRLLNDEELAIRGNDMELFHFLSAGPHVINYASRKIEQNLNDIRDLILNKKFLPFPPRPRNEGVLIGIESYPPMDGYENHRQLNVIARAIILRPELVKMWKQIGYHEICSDVNELVIQGALLILFPPTLPEDWKYPDANMVLNKLKELFDMGFQLNQKVINGTIGNRPEVKNVLLESYKIINKNSNSSE